ncbi:NUDIX domain-containing protein [Microbacterium neungamense]|uniref:NUDIX domain-containing protein n=1 Tax=Microbacterium neungamense TaxID=2810535 RepID=UPI00217CE907|nr:NUDIX hydrolase [Microbacterium neungamense]UWF76833.1 NUDIX hydrolase [Microbacterium neungamense]
MSDAASAAGLRDEPFQPEVLESTLAYRGAVWDVRDDRVRYGDGEIRRQYVDHTGAVAVVALDDEGRVLLIQQYRHPIRCRDWELPAGLLDVEGEEPLLAAQRELAEEADIVAAHWEPLLSTYTTPGGNSEIIHVFLATGLARVDAVHSRIDEEADIRVAWVPLSEAADAVLEGRMRNAVLSIGVLAAERRLGATRTDGGASASGSAQGGTRAGGA